MANTSLFDLVAFTALASGDVIPVVDISDSTQSADGSLKKITVANVFTTIPGGVTALGQIKTTLTTQQLALHYDASNHLAVTVASNGAVTFNASGAGASFSFPDKTAFGGAYPAAYISPLVVIGVSGSQFQTIYDVDNGLSVSVASDGGVTVASFGTDDEIQFITPKLFFGTSPGTAVAYPNYTAATGTATRTTFATGSVTLPELAERVKAMIDDLLAVGLFT